ncbi:MAG: NAD(P)H-dependent oxidoreductase [Clostridia bacterium]|nr:NAD(P)H-dependent oxidoreductase [Clostridia bacterium]
MKTAVVYYSMSGNTELAAERIAAVLGADLIRLTPVKAYPDKGFRKFFWGGKSAVMGEKPALEPFVFRAEDYEQVILGTPIWAGTFAPPLRTFADRYRDALAGKSLAFFACMSGSGAEKAAAKLAECLGIDAFTAALALIDPKIKPDPDLDTKIEAFCAALK